MKKLFLLSYILLNVFFASAQKVDCINISGIVIDRADGNGIPFASVWIEGTNMGVSTNFDGSFYIQIPKESANSKINFTSVGYTSVDILIADCKNKVPLTISLDAKLFVFDEVNITGKSLVLERFLKNATARIKTNYLQKPFSSDSYFKSEYYYNDSLINTREAALQIYDKDAYVRSSVLKTFESISYRFIEARRTFNPTTLEKSSTLLEDILTFDIVRNPRNILDKHNVDNFKLEKVGDIYSQGDSLIVISYKALDNNISLVGQSAVKEYTGKIYINKTDYSIAKNELKIICSDYNYLGKSVINNEAKNKDVEINVNTSYAKINGFYYLKDISMSLIEEDQRIESHLVTVKIKTTVPSVFTGREYYEDAEYKKYFWDRYSIVFEGEE